MKNFSKILFSLACILGFATNVKAASYSNTITAYASSTKYEYIEGLPIYYHQASSYNLYVLDNNTRFTTSTTLRDPEEVNSGYAYIVNNSSVTNSSYKNYYIAQVAILWYEDYLKGNNVNISSSIKEYITNNKSEKICYYINKLVNNAKTYSTNNSYIKFNDKDITFTKNGNYYYSNVIDVETKNLNSTPSVKLYNAPSSSTIINNTISKDGEGSFQIRIPATSLTSYYKDDFEVYITGTGYNYSVYKYSNYGYDDAIYGRVYTNSSSSIEESIVAKIDDITNTNNKVRISIVDTNGYYINGLSYRVYEGSCATTTCNSNDLVTTFTTTRTYITLDGILNEGIYTLERLTDTNYQIPKKQTISVTDSNYVQEITIDESDYIYNDEYENDSYTIRIYSDLNDSTNIIKVIDDSNDKIVYSFRSNESYVDVTLTPGLYCIIDTDDSMEIFFEITETGLLYVHENGKEVKRNSINVQDYLLRYTQDNEDIYTDEDGTIHIGNLDNIDSIEISQEVNTEVSWLNNIIDCPITSLSSTLKYVVGAIILSAGAYLVIRNVKKSKNNI